MRLQDAMHPPQTAHTHSDAAGSHDSAAAIMERVSLHVYSTGYPLTIHPHGYTRRGLSKLQWGDTDVETCKLIFTHTPCIIGQRIAHSESEN